MSQNSDRAEVLHQIKQIWKCGTIRPDRSDKTLKFEVRNISELVERVIPHFDEFPLQSSKQKDVELFKTVCLMVKESKHLELEGFKEIVKLAMKMNPSGKRKYSGSVILNSLRTDERIVYASGQLTRT